MIIKEVQLHKVNMRMKNPFKTSFGTEQNRLFIIIEIRVDTGQVGWGECVTSALPLYVEEFTDSAWQMLEQHLIPLVLNEQLDHPDDLERLFLPFKRNNLAKAAIEGAIWDVYAKREGKTLAECIGGDVNKEIDVGVSLGLENHLEDLFRSIESKVAEGYKRIKLKIKPGNDVQLIDSVRNRFPHLPLMVDANCSYTLDDIDLLKSLDTYNLMMIEQPLTAGDLIDHAKLQKEIKTPICLDESIHSYDNARQAIEIGAAKIINLKIGRVGGITIAMQIHDMCMEAGIPVWCGGMLESGIGRAHNIAISSLANFTIPGDTASSSKYWDKDIIEPEVVTHKGILNVPKSPGIGYKVNREELAKHTVTCKAFN